MGRVRLYIPSKRYRPPKPKKLPKGYKEMGMSAKETVRITKLLKDYYEELRVAGVIHWNRKMGMKKLKEMFPDVYKKEKARLRCGSLSE